MLLGYRVGDVDTDKRLELVVTDTIAAGPGARRRRWWFAPDGPWQQEHLENAYQASGRVATYLGDWHSHPRGVPRPSMLDRRTYARVAADLDTATNLPLMVILAPKKSLAVGAFLVDSQRQLLNLEVHPYTP
jgi:integrative and conjugative element protein (TIGR02256 family)